MLTKLKLNPGQKGTKKLVRKYGDQLVCVRYRYDPEHKKRFKTIELIIDEIPWEPKPKANNLSEKIVQLHVRFEEIKLRQSVKAAGGKWQPDRKVWELPYNRAIKLKLEDRIISI